MYSSEQRLSRRNPLLSCLIIPAISLVVFQWVTFAESWPPEFGEPVNLGEINSAAHDAGPDISVDGLTIYFGSTRAGSWDIYMATRESVDSVFNEPIPLDSLNTHHSDGEPGVSSDQLTIYFHRVYSPEYIRADILVATRESVRSAFGPPSKMSVLDLYPYWNRDPEISPNDMEILFRKSSDGVYRSVRDDPADPFGEPLPLAGTKALSRSPSLTGDGKTLAYGYEIRGNSNDGLWIARREFGLPGEEFTDHARIPGFTDVAEVDLSSDGRYLYFHDIRAGGEGGIDIWVAERIEPTPAATPTPVPTSTPQLPPLTGELSNGYVSPQHGTTTTDFSWYVDYSNGSDGDPTSAVVVVDGVPFEMTKQIEGGTTDTYRFGPIYLPPGQHTYYFEFTDWGGSGRLPVDPGSRFYGPAVSDGSLPVIVLDLDASTEEIEERLAVAPGVTYEGAVRLLSFPTGDGETGYTGYNLKLKGTPCCLCAASTTAGDHPLDVPAGVDTSNAGEGLIGRALVQAVPLFQAAPARMFSFEYCITEDVALTFRADSPDFGLLTLGTSYLLQDGDVLFNSGMITVDVSQIPTPTPTPRPFEVILTVSIEPAEPGTLDDLECVTEVENLGGYPELFYSYRWFRDGEELTDPLDVGGEILPVRESILSHYYTAKNETFFCVARVTDGTDAVEATTDPVTILNSPPTQPQIVILPENPGPGDGLAVWITEASVDPDGDPVGIVFQWFESENGEDWHLRMEVSGGFDPYDRGEPEVSGLYTQMAEYWRVEVTPVEFSGAGKAGGWYSAEELAALGVVGTGESVLGDFFIMPDLNHDGIVDGEDLVVLRRAWHRRKSEMDPALSSLFFEPKAAAESQVGAEFLFLLGGNGWHMGGPE